MQGHDRLALGDWVAIRSTGELRHGDRTVSVEPKVMDLLWCLAAHGTGVVSRETLLASLWPGRVVTDDALARLVFKLRLALADTERPPRYVGTVPKRGYRLLVAAGVPCDPPPGRAAPAGVERSRARGPRIAIAAGVTTILLVLGFAGASLVADARASRVLAMAAADAYAQYTYHDNESAIALYEGLLERRAHVGPAHAGLAGALAQRAIRWPSGAAAGARVYTTLGEALAGGMLETDSARATLGRALAHANAAVAEAPRDPRSWRSRGLVLSAQGRLRDALLSYERALAQDPDDWGSLVNRGDVLELLGRRAEGLANLEAAHAAMWRRYGNEPARIRPWYGPLGVAIGDRLAALGDTSGARRAYARVLLVKPHDPVARARFAAVASGW